MNQISSPAVLEVRDAEPFGKVEWDHGGREKRG